MTISSRLLDAQAVAAMTEMFGLAYQEHAPVFGGQDSETYLVRTDCGRFILTLLQRNEQTAVALAEYVHEVHALGIPVPRYLSRLDGRGSIVVHEGTPAILQVFVPGESRSDLSSEALRGLGEIVGRLHGSGLRCPMPPRLRLAGDWLEQAGELPDRTFTRWLARWHDRVAHVVTLAYAHVPTHGDLFPDNIIFEPASGPVLIDWADASQDSLLMELGMVALGLCCVERAFAPARLATFIGGYAVHHDVTIKRDDLRDAAIYAGLVVAYQRCVEQTLLKRWWPHDRSYAMIPPLVDSLHARWDDVRAPWLT